MLFNEFEVRTIAKAHGLGEFRDASALRRFNGVRSTWNNVYGQSWMVCNRIRRHGDSRSPFNQVEHEVLP